MEERIMPRRPTARFPRGRPPAGVDPGPAGPGRASLVLLLVLGATMALAGCDDGEESPPLDVELEIETTAEEIAPGEPLRVRYSWRPGASFETPDRDLLVFLHVLDEEGEIVMQGDHSPPVPTSQWKAGEPVEYERWLYLPIDLSAAEIDLVAGIYEADTRYAILHDGARTSTALVAELPVTPRDIAALPVPVEGWYAMATEEDTRPFHWTRGRAVVLFRNPGGPAILHLSGQGVVNLAGGSQRVVVRVEGQVVDRLEITDQHRFTRRYELADEVLGDRDQVRVTLRIVPTFVPARVQPGSPDDRELGIRVYTLFLAPDEGDS